MTPLTEDERLQLAPTLLNLRIIVLALCLGVSTFAGFSIYQKLPPAAAEGPQQIWPPLPQLGPKGMTPVHVAALLFAGVAATLAFVLPPFLGRLQTDPGVDRASAIHQAAQIMHQRTIVACALLEGAAFFNIFCFFTTDSIYNLAMAGILVLLLVLRFPLSGAYFSKIERIIGVDPFTTRYG